MPESKQNTLVSASTKDENGQEIFRVDLSQTDLAYSESNLRNGEFCYSKSAL